MVFVIAGLAVFAAGIWSASDKHHENGAALGLILGVFLTPVSIFWFLRERRYFDPHNEYWIEIGFEEFALVTPDATDRSKWADLTPI